MDIDEVDQIAVQEDAVQEDKEEEPEEDLLRRQLTEFTSPMGSSQTVSNAKDHTTANSSQDVTIEGTASSADSSVLSLLDDFISEMEQASHEQVPIEKPAPEQHSKHNLRKRPRPRS